MINNNPITTVESAIITLTKQANMTEPAQTMQKAQNKPQCNQCDCILLRISEGSMEDFINNLYICAMTIEKAPLKPI
jgi:hypothetical protein